MPLSRNIHPKNIAAANEARTGTRTAMTPRVLSRIPSNKNRPRWRRTAAPTAAWTVVASNDGFVTMRFSLPDCVARVADSTRVRQRESITGLCLDLSGWAAWGSGGGSEGNVGDCVVDLWYGVPLSGTPFCR